MAASTLCPIKDWACNRKERVVMGDLYRQHRIMRPGWNVSFNVLAGACVFLRCEGEEVSLRASAIRVLHLEHTKLALLTRFSVQLLLTR